MENKMILWIEDLENSVADQKVWCEQKGFKVKIVNHPARFAQYLTKYLKEIQLIVVDIMLAGINNLTTIGIPDSDTLGGKEAGWELVRRLLRADPSSEYASIPVLIVSARMKSERDKGDIVEYSEQGMSEIRYIEKRNPMIDWSEQFKKDVLELTNTEKEI